MKIESDSEPEGDVVVTETASKKKDHTEHTVVETSVVVKPAPVFETFKTNKTLRDGLCVVRSLGGRKYELVNLNTVDGAAFSSEEIGSRIKNVPECLKLLQTTNENWEEVKLKVGQAVGSASTFLVQIRRDLDNVLTVYFQLPPSFAS